VGSEQAGGVPEPISVTDGLIVLRRPRASDAGPLSAARRSVSGAVTMAEHLAGWVSYAGNGQPSGPREAAIGVGILSSHCGRGAGTRAIQLLMHHLAVRTSYRTVALAIDPRDEALLAVAARTGFAARTGLASGYGTTSGERQPQRLVRPVPPLTYSDGVVTIRRQRPEDIDAHLEAIDDEQIDWLWQPGEREQWQAMTPQQQRAGNLAHLRACQDRFGTGPKWTFSVDAPGASYVSYVDCDLANDSVPPGEANISYTAHPAYRGRGYVSRSVRLIARFLAEHTGARSAHIIVDAENAASLRVARAVGATETERWVSERGRVMVRHVLPVR
jgi:RimJ/RimL family protein N-acetyltransferase